MSFKLFIYYCALCGGWAAFAAWLVLWAVGVADPNYNNLFLKATLIGGFLGLMVAAGVGAVDAKLNAVGFQRVLRVIVCMGVGLAGGALGGLVGEALHFNDYLVFIGWILVGIAIGASIGVFDVLRAAMTGQNVGVALKKVQNGVYGGLLGGFVGGIFFGLFLGSREDAAAQRQPRHRTRHPRPVHRPVDRPGPGGAEGGVAEGRVGLPGRP